MDFGCDFTLGQLTEITQKCMNGKNMFGIILWEYTPFPLRVAPSPSNNMYCSLGERAKEPNEL